VANALAEQTSLFAIHVIALLHIAFFDAPTLLLVPLLALVLQAASQGVQHGTVANAAHCALLMCY